MNNKNMEETWKKHEINSWFLNTLIHLWIDDYKLSEKFLMVLTWKQYLTLNDIRTFDDNCQNIEILSCFILTWELINGF